MITIEWIMDPNQMETSDDLGLFDIFIHLMRDKTNFSFWRSHILLQVRKV